MKKLFLILFLACNFVAHANPIFKTDNFRWRNDNGNETSATWKALRNAEVTLTTRNQNIRLRLHIYAPPSSGSPGSLFYKKIYYSKNGGAKVPITNDASKDFILSSSNFVTNGDTTTNQLPLTYTFQKGYFVSEIGSPTVSYSFTLAPSSSTELEYCISATDAAANSATYTFYPDTTYNTYVNQPASLTTQFCEVPSTPTTNFSSGGINYIVTSSTTVAVGNNTSATGVVVIPDAVTVDCRVLSVTSIGAGAFSGCSGLTSVTIPNTITSMGNNAFLNCTGLTSVICNVSTPISVDATVFSGVNQANCSLNVPNASIVAYQAAAVWQNFTPIVCNPTENITDVASFCSYTWANNNQTYTSSGLYTGLTTNCVTEKINLTINPAPTNFSSGGINYVVTSPTTVDVASNANATGSIVIPATVTTSCGTYAVKSIVASAFLNCTGLMSVTIPNSLTSIGVQAFRSCSGLTTVTIPNSVTSIASEAFLNCTGLTSVTIPNSVTTIGSSAFRSCSGLTTVNIPNAVTSIGEAAFNGCTGLTSVTLSNAITTIQGGTFFNCSSLTSVTIPNSVTTIGADAFKSCSGLTSVTIGNSVTSFGNSSFQSCSSLTSITIPNSVTSIGIQAFRDCIGLTSVTIGNSVTRIEPNAFNNCTGLTSVICNVSTPVTIAQNAGIFAGVNQGACSLTVPNASIAAYQAAAVWQNFAPIVGCNPTFDTTTISACGSYTWSVNSQTYTTSGSYTSLIGCATEILNLTIKTTPAAPSVNVVNNCNGTSTLSTTATGTLLWSTTETTSPITVSSAGTYNVTQTLNGCVSPSGSGVAAPKTSNTGDTTAFACNSFVWYGTTYTASATPTRTFTNVSGCDSVVTLNLTITTQPTNFSSGGINYVVTSPTTVAVGTNSIAIGVVVIPASVTTACGTYAVTGINEGAFFNRTGLTSVTIPNSVTSMGNIVFQGCSSLTSITIGNSLTSIGFGAFASCSRLTSVILPNSLTNVGVYAFINCSSLTSVTLPNAITSLSEGIFNGCSQLASISIPNSVTTIGDNAFRNCSSLTSITIPNTVMSIGNQVFQNCSGLTSVSVSNSVPSIGNQCFQFCTSLTSVTIPNSVTSIGQNAFQGCSNLGSVTLSNALTIIGSGAFNSCVGLSTINIPNAVTSIGSFAFVSCSGLTTVTIGNSVTSIDASAFSGCTGLTSVICNVSTPVTIATNVFASVNQAACSLTVPNASITAYRAATVWQNFAPIICANPFVDTTTITGIKNVCNYIGTNYTVTYTASAQGATTYTWTLPPNTELVEGQGTATITVKFTSGFASQPNKQIRVVASSVCGSNTLKIYYLAAQLPVTPSTIVPSTTNVCPRIGTNVPITYRIQKVLGAASYIWSSPSSEVSISHPNGLGENDTLITITFSSNYTSSSISVQSINDCGTSGTRSLVISRNNPSTPGLISGPTNACEYIGTTGVNATYSISAASNVDSYTWTLPAGVTNVNGQGTNTITFRYPSGFTSGTVSVSATNGCGTSFPRSLTINRLSPITPSNIDVINTSSCPNRLYTYSVIALPGNATSLEWNVPNGGTIESGQGTRSITVSYATGVIDGAVSVRSINNCGVSSYKTAIVKLAPCPAGPTAQVTKGLPIVANNSMEVKVFPNPTTSFYNLQVIDNVSTSVINVRVLDVQGRLIKTIVFNPNENITLGSDFRPGVYMLEFNHRREKKVMRVVKY